MKHSLTTPAFDLRSNEEVAYNSSQSLLLAQLTNIYTVTISDKNKCVKVQLEAGGCMAIISRVGANRNSGILSPSSIDHLQYHYFTPAPPPRESTKVSELSTSNPEHHSQYQLAVEKLAQQTSTESISALAS
ncbi:hypothetical protein BGZ60DRAFT_535661 [Tricladium varicosporioides]|nr:hypothetical protein BGZ60DRAFT_535661 [Hymenoscyphus varicosporioides]